MLHYTAGGQAFGVLTFEGKRQNPILGGWTAAGILRIACDESGRRPATCGKQVPTSRAVPLCGGISAHGLAPVVLHPAEERRTEQLIDAVEGGSLLSALAGPNLDRRRGPWTVVCDSGRFLSTGSKQAHAKARVCMWQVPPRSTDFNPIEKHWAWLRKSLVARDLGDAVAKCLALDRAGRANRVRAICRTQRAQSVAAACRKSLRKTCAGLYITEERSTAPRRRTV